MPTPEEFAACFLRRIEPGTTRDFSPFRELASLKRRADQADRLREALQSLVAKLDVDERGAIFRSYFDEARAALKETT